MANDIKMRPLGDRLIIKPVAVTEKNRGGIIIVETVQDKPNEGVVIAAGKGRVADDGKLIPMDVKVGDHVLYGKYSGSDIKIKEEAYIIMREEDILTIIEE
jgi:chaperonin GroES